MNPKRRINITQMTSNSATCDPRARRAWNRAWMSQFGRTAPIQMLKGLAWVASNGNRFKGTPSITQPLTSSAFAPGTPLAPGFGVTFSGDVINIYNKYGNIDYKTVGALMLMLININPDGGWTSAVAGMQGIFPNGVKDFDDPSHVQKITDDPGMVSGIDGFISDLLRTLRETFKLSEIVVFDAPFVLFEASQEVDIPMSEVLNDKYGITGLDKSKFKGPALPELIMDLKLGMNAILVGPTGTGKSECVLEAFGFADPDRDVQVIEGHESLREIDLLGGFVPAEKAGQFRWADGVLVTAMRNGSFLFVDEANRMPTRTLNVLLGVLSRHAVVLTDHGSEIVRAAEGFTVVMAMNQGQGYAVNSLDRALIDRFPTAIEFHYLDAKSETDLVVERTGLNTKIARMMVKMAQDVRELARIGEFESGISPRGLFAWSQKYQALAGNDENVNRTLLVKTAEQTWVRGVAGVGVDGYMEREVVNRLNAMIYDLK